MRAIVLAHESEFSIGPLRISPSNLTLARGERTEVLEPRVMQVLVALAQAEGDVVSRDDLIEACWNGRIVGDDAVHRVLGRLRRTAEGLGKGVFVVDTITRVGYRLRLLDAARMAERPRHLRGDAPHPIRISRRGLTLGGAAVGAGAFIGGMWLWESTRTQQRARAASAALIEQARIAMAQDTREGQNQAIALFRQIVTEDAGDADAWGFLALTYASTSHYRQSSEAEVLQGRAVSAAKRALSIDRDNPIARSGLALARPIVGNWSRVGSALEQSAQQKPHTYEVTFSFGRFLAAVGRNREALHYETLLSPSQPIPSNYYNRAQLLWSVGQEEDLDNLLSEAARVFPTHYAIWFTRFYVPMLSGRPEEALALAADTTQRPTNIDPAEVEAVVRVARAIQSQGVNEVESVAREWMSKAHAGAGYAENAVQFLVALNRIDDAFAVLRAYFFSDGFDCGEIRFSASQGTYTPHNDRLTAWLFNPAMARARADRRFAAIVDRLRLARYWSDARVRPDYLSSGT